MNRLILLLFVVSTTLVFGQQSTNVITPSVTCKTADKTGQWVEYFSNDQLTVEYKFIECDPEIGFNQEKVILRMTNHTSDELKLDWHVLLEYNQVCRTCDFPDEYTYHLFLQPNQTKEGDCSIYSELFELKIFSHFLDSRAKEKDELSSFQLSQFVITRIPQN